MRKNEDSKKKVVMAQAKELTYPNVKQGKYLITEYGDVYDRENNRFISTHFSPDGYVRVGLRRNDDPTNTKTLVVAVHRLVANQFCPNNNLNLTVDHIDCDKTNNHCSNLEWVDRQTNVRRAYLNKCRVSTKSYKSEEQIRTLCRYLQDTDMTCVDCCKASGIKGISKSYMETLCNHIIYGKDWKYISCDYDFSRRKELSKKHQKNQTVPDFKIHELCNLLQTTDYTYKEILNIVGLKNMNTQICGDLVNHKTYRHISLLYDFSQRKHINSIHAANQRYK